VSRCHLPLTSGVWSAGSLSSLPCRRHPSTPLLRHSRCPAGKGHDGLVSPLPSRRRLDLHRVLLLRGRPVSSCPVTADHNTVVCVPAFRSHNKIYHQQTPVLHFFFVAGANRCCSGRRSFADHLSGGGRFSAAGAPAVLAGAVSSDNGPVFGWSYCIS